MTTAVWLGFDRGQGNSLGTNQTGAQTAGPIWAQYMKEVHHDLPVREFERPPGIVERVITERSGLLPTEDYHGATLTEIFIAGTEPTTFDTLEDYEDQQREDVVWAYTHRRTPVSEIAREIRLQNLLDTALQDDESEGDGTDGGSDGSNPFLDDPDTQPSQNGEPGLTPSDTTGEGTGDESAGGKSTVVDTDASVDIECQG